MGCRYRLVTTEPVCTLTIKRKTLQFTVKLGLRTASRSSAACGARSLRMSKTASPRRSCIISN